MADLDHLHPEFRRRVLATRHRVESGARSTEEQRRLHEGWVKRKPGFNPANRPGTSWHEFGRGIPGGEWALAVDFAGPPYPHDAAGLCWPIAGEPWHAQPKEIRESERVKGADQRLPRVQVAPPPDPDPLRLGGRAVMVLSNSLTRINLVPVHAGGGKALDIEGGAVNDGARCILWDRTGAPNQKFIPLPISNEEFILIAHHSGRVLDVKWGKLEPMSELHQWEMNLGPAQRWIKKPAGPDAFRISPTVRPDLFVTFHGGGATNGSWPVLWTEGGDDQVFRFEAVT